MKHLWVCIAAVMAMLYAASGFYIVKGNQQALVRRFGKARPPLVGSGLHYDLPWPLAQVDRINLHEVRAVSVGIPSGETDGRGVLIDGMVERQAEFLTGDKNILHVQVHVPYQIVDPYQYAFSSESTETSLRLLAESVVTEVIAQSGVDFVHPLGLHELREILTRRLRAAADSQQWGIAVEDATIVGVFPPVEVKASFLDVSNARAEKERIINEEQTRGERLLAGAKAAARQMQDKAQSDRHARVEAARGSADRFRHIIGQFQRESQTGAPSYAAARHMTMLRMYSAALEELLPRLARKVILDAGKPIDFTIFPGAEKPVETAQPPAQK